MPGSILGTAVRRVEDLDLITGASTFVGYLALPDTGHLAFVRSPLAHARITGIDIAAAAAAAAALAGREPLRRPGPAGRRRGVVRARMGRGTPPRSPCWCTTGSASRWNAAAGLFGFEVANTETPTPLNPLGAKGIGESATVGATPAVQNAVIDALRPFGIRHLDLPCSPQRVWRALQEARAGRPADPWREPPAVFADLPQREGGEAAGRAEI